MRWIKDMILGITKGKECFFIDLNRTKTIWFNAHKKKTFKFRLGEYVMLDNYNVDTTKSKRNIIVYNSKYAEPLSFEFDEDNTLYKIRSDEFRIVYNNKLMTQLLYVKEKGLITAILAVAVGALGIGVMNYVQTQQLMESVNILIGV